MEQKLRFWSGVLFFVGLLAPEFLFLSLLTDWDEVPSDGFFRRAFYPFIERTDNKVMALLLMTIDVALMIAFPPYFAMRCLVALCCIAAALAILTLVAIVHGIAPNDEKVSEREADEERQPLVRSADPKAKQQPAVYGSPVSGKQCKGESDNPMGQDRFNAPTLY